MFWVSCCQLCSACGAFRRSTSLEKNANIPGVDSFSIVSNHRSFLQKPDPFSLGFRRFSGGFLERRIPGMNGEGTSTPCGTSFSFFDMEKKVLGRCWPLHQATTSAFLPANHNHGFASGPYRMFLWKIENSNRNPRKCGSPTKTGGFPIQPRGNRNSGQKQ